MTDPLIPLRTDADITAMAQHLVGTAIRRQVWIFLLDEEDRSIPQAVALDGLPADPDPEDVAVLAERLRQLVDATGAAAAVLVWERPGGPELRMLEADWIAGLVAAGAPLRAQLLASDEGVRLLDPAFEQIVAA